MAKNKICWIADSFSYNGLIPEDDRDGYNFSAKIEKSIVDEHMIKLVTKPVNFGEGVIGYFVNLIHDDFSKKYIGKYQDTEDVLSSGYVECELFSNRWFYFLIGTWIETGDDEESKFTWFAKIEK